jgi:uncharacterized protein
MTQSDRSSSAHSEGPRPGTRAVPGRRLPAALPMARLGARAAPRGARQIADAPRTGSLEEIARAKRALLITYRRAGTPVPTPVWAAPAGGALYVRTERGSGKVKRLRHNPRLLVAPCTAAGRPLGPPLEASATVLCGEDEHAAERALASRYGLGRELFERAMDLMRVDMCYLRVTPGAWD